jgi:hypothetical protein
LIHVQWREPANQAANAFDATASFFDLANLDFLARAVRLKCRAIAQP